MFATDGLEPSLLRRLFLVALLLYLPFFAPRLAADGALYHEVLRSLAVDGDLNFDNERQFYTWRYVPVFAEYGVGEFVDTGYLRHPFNVGAPLFWFPFFKLGQGAAWILERLSWGHPPVIADGYSLPERLAVSVTSLPLSLVGIVLTVRLVRSFRLAGRAATGSQADDDLALALPATLVMALASPLPAFVLATPTFSHALSYALSTAFLVVAVETFGKDRSQEEDLALGLLLGLAALVRTQAVFLGVLLLLEPARRRALGISWREVARRSVPGYLRVGAAAILAFSPQLASNLVVFGKLFLDPQGEGGMHWLAPQVSLMLWNSKHGLYATTPWLLVATLAMPLLMARHRWLGGVLLLAVGLQFYVNASRRDWAGVGFGARRFLDVLPVLTVAFAELLWRLRRRPVVAAVLGLGATAAVWNFLLMGLYYMTDLSRPTPPPWPSFGSIVRWNLDEGPASLMRLSARSLVVEALSEPGMASLTPLLLLLLALGGAYAALVALERAQRILVELLPVLVLGLVAVLVTVDIFFLYSRWDTRHVQAFLLDEHLDLEEEARRGVAPEVLRRLEGQAQTADLVWRRRHLALRNGAAYEGLLGGFQLGSDRAGILAADVKYPGGFLDEGQVQATVWPATEPVLNARADGSPIVAVELVLSYARWDDLPGEVLVIGIERRDGGPALSIPLRKDPTGPDGRGLRVNHADAELGPAERFPHMDAYYEGAVALRLLLKSPVPASFVRLRSGEGATGLLITGLALEPAR